jgi:hypothetical protein
MLRVIDVPNHQLKISPSMGSGSRIKDRKLDKFGHSFLVKQEAEASSSHCRFERHIPPNVALSRLELSGDFKKTERIRNPQS